MRKASMSVGVCALEMMTVAVGSAEAFRDDSHGYRSMRAYSYGPPYGRSYFSGATIRVHDDGHYYRYHRRYDHSPGVIRKMGPHRRDGTSPQLSWSALTYRLIRYRRQPSEVASSTILAAPLGLLLGHQVLERHAQYRRLFCDGGAQLAGSGNLLHALSSRLTWRSPSDALLWRGQTFN